MFTLQLLAKMAAVKQRSFVFLMLTQYLTLLTVFFIKMWVALQCFLYTWPGDASIDIDLIVVDTVYSNLLCRCRGMFFSLTSKIMWICYESVSVSLHCYSPSLLYRTYLFLLLVSRYYFPLSEWIRCKSLHSHTFKPACNPAPHIELSPWRH